MAKSSQPAVSSDNNALFWQIWQPFGQQMGNKNHRIALQNGGVFKSAQNLNLINSDL
ncbi:hypothetical protein AO382_0551 [Moraxella catarrhalis]|uniref:Uncharacterized protein n=1 Tax=Moraxella catarrhalis TaxID=480 RepID=A0A7Z0V135_MORCA|nr:hypothetical protein AO382_0551 [Moraxella catarrhalis]